VRFFSFVQTGPGYTQRAETLSSFELKEIEERVLQCLAGYPFFSVGVDTKHIEDEKQALAQPLAQALANIAGFAEKPGGPSRCRQRGCESRVFEVFRGGDSGYGERGNTAQNGCR
jgi:hypothetical protein